MEVLNTLEETFLGALPPTWLHHYRSLLDSGNVHSRNFPLMNPFHVVLVVIFYLVMIAISKAIMRDRKKFELTWFSILHNGAMVILNAYMCYEIINQAIINKFSLFGNGVDPTPNGLPLARVLWLFYFSKPIEFTDTFIMILKKNFHQVSFLHVYHHFATFAIWWAVLYYVPGGDTYFSAAQNAFIHVLMYSYYLMAALKINCPWKKYLTQAQMLQFVLNMVQSVYVLIYDTPYPKVFAGILITYMASLLALFGNFYIKSIQKPREAKQKKSE
eukprot:TRINITY_DN4810_c0_g1_i1.p1 TRINITY_DN4810_c0_g1~~TRINITY_DN4810_c0_g1_i1.p1  ORF type:complete len:273 (-),score=52.48 TRINITY_DN4810_c0_g1_i1:501-1319(-)